MILICRTYIKLLRIFVLQFSDILKESKLGDFEETLLLLVGILNKDAYAFRIALEFEKQTKRPVSIGAVHSTLNRISEKGFLKSEMSGATAERGGRRKRIYTITASGQKALEISRSLKLSLWDQFPAFATGNLNFSS